MTGHDQRSIHGTAWGTKGGDPLQIDVNGSLQSCIDNANITVNASFPKSFRCIIAGPSECGKTFLLKNLFLSSIQFNRLYIIGPTGDQYEELKIKDVVFIKEIQGLPSPDQLPKDIKKLKIFDDVGGKEPVINEYICRGRHSNYNMMYLEQNTFSADRQNVRENCNLFIIFEQRGRATTAIYHYFFSRAELSYDDFCSIYEKVLEEPYNYIVIEKSKKRKFNGKLRINWDWRALEFNNI